MAYPPAPSYQLNPWQPPGAPAAPPPSAALLPPPPHQSSLFPPGVVPPPPPDGLWRASRVDHVAGTEFGLVQFQVPPMTSGQATGSLIAGLGSVLVSLLVLCFGLAGSGEGWGGWVAGAFTVLGVLTGAGAITLGVLARRQISRSGRSGQVRFSGRGVALAGICCGAAGAGISLIGLVFSLVLQLS